MKKIIALVLLAALAIVGCDTAQQIEYKTIEQNQKALLAAYPIPRMDTSLERDIVIQMYSLRNEARNTWSVITSDGTGKPMYDCPSVGFPIANDVRLVNEGQAEPNGLYPASNSWGTWVLCVDDNGGLNPIYNEMDTLTFPFPVDVDYVTGAITKNGDPSIVLNIKSP